MAGNDIRLRKLGGTGGLSRPGWILVIGNRWTGYQRTYVERDARLAGEVNDWQQFGLFLRLAGALTAQEINYSQLGREIGLTPQSARR